MISRERVRELIRETFRKNGLPESQADQIQLEWNDRFTSRMGDANHSKQRIRLSTPLFRRATVEQQENTVIHEACHVIAREKFGRGIKSHGGEWKACMIIAGYEPTRCHSIDRTGLKKTRKTYSTSCGCAKLHMVTKKVWIQVAYGYKYTCRRCKCRLKLTKEKAG